MSLIMRPEYWLPRNVSWEDMPTRWVDMATPIRYAIPLIVFRICWEAFVGIPLGAALGHSGKGSLGKRILQHLMGGFASNTRSKRILECFWRFSFYAFAFIYGCVVMRNKSWLYDIRQCWIGYPRHSVPQELWNYYMLETGFYYSLLIASVFDIRRSDFWQLIFHHIVTIGLLSVSWAINFVRVGTLVLLSHDLADVFLEFGKLVRYDRRKAILTNIMFGLFFTSWIATRLGYFPFILLRSALFEAASLIQPDYDLLDFTQLPYAPRLVISMLFMLLLLHIFWTFLIVKVIFRMFSDGEACDVRSDSEESDDEARRERTKKLTKRAKKD